MVKQFLKVLIPYLHADFEGGEKPKGGPLEIEFFFVEGDFFLLRGLTKVGGGGSGAF